MTNNLSPLSDWIGDQLDALASHPAFASRLVIDDYPNQPVIVEWPITEQERIDMATLESITADAFRAQAANPHEITISADVLAALIAAGVIK